MLGDTFRLDTREGRLPLAADTAGIRAAKRDGKLAAVLHFQGTCPFEYDLDLAEVYWRLGVRVVQLAYDVRARPRTGARNRATRGSAGRPPLVAEFNRLGMVVDVSHTGHASSMEAVAASAAPFIASHSNAAAVHSSRRNLQDDLIRAIADSGGVIGVNGYPAFVADTATPALDQYIDHLAYIAGWSGLVTSASAGLHRPQPAGGGI